MINANRQDLQIEGSQMDIIFELNHIFELLIQNHPELIIGVMAGWTDILMQVTTNLTDKQDCIRSIITDISIDYIKMCKK